MRINDLKAKQLTGKKGTDKTKAGNSTDFLNLLEGQLKPIAGSAPTESTTMVESTPQIPTQLRLTGVSLSENTINILESFSEALKNLELQSADLLPLVEALEGGTTSLLDIKEQLPPEDPLTQLIDHVITISFVEVEKFRRGDYR